MATYRTPGVYVEEISTLPASVAQVETAIPAFIGYTQKGAPGAGEDPVAVRLTTLLEYENAFGSAKLTGGAVSVDDSSGSRVITVDSITDTNFVMWYQMKMYFDNGGGPCYVVSVGDDTTGATDTTGYEAGLGAVAKEDEPTLIVFPDAPSFLDASQYYGLVDKALMQCQDLKDRFTIIDVHGDFAALDPDTDAGALRSASFGGTLNYGAAYYPPLKSLIPFEVDESSITISYTPDPNDTSSPPVSLGADLADLESTNTQAYNQVKAALGTTYITLYPCGAMAGIYARVDASRGVWKAPANVGVSSVAAPAVKITNTIQDTLNVDATGGRSVNAIRAFAGRGVLVWGARTLAGNDNEWRYINVRRLFINVEESIQKATSWSVFESNDANTWTRLKAQIENFLTGLWQDGALAGAAAADAFFVNVGLGTTMTSEDILNGVLNIEIGIAPVRPAEFIVLKFSQKLQES